MKTNIKNLVAATLISASIHLSAQTEARKTSIGLISLDTKEIAIEPTTMGNMVRTELEKLDTFSVVDRYDILQYLEKSQKAVNICFGKQCLVEVGRELKCDKMISGSVEKQGKFILFTYRLINVNTAELERTYVHEFLFIPEEIQNMIKVSVAEMFNKPYDKNLMNKLSKRFELANSTNTPDVDVLNLAGPRMGFTSFSGELLTIVKGKKSDGGFDLYPMMFQFGYQFEKQYLNEGKIQALFEFIPMITGLDQGYILPSVSVLHGLRSNVSGWEFAFGPSFNITKIGKGYYDENDNWHLNSEWGKNPENAGKTNPYETKERMDSRGNYKLESYFVIAAGKTFKSGRLNIPVNAFVIPGRYGWRFGVSFGFNGKNR